MNSCMNHSVSFCAVPTRLQILKWISSVDTRYKSHSHSLIHTTYIFIFWFWLFAINHFDTYHLGISSRTKIWFWTSDFSHINRKHMTMGNECECNSIPKSIDLFMVLACLDIVTVRSSGVSVCMCVSVFHSYVSPSKSKTYLFIDKHHPSRESWYSIDHFLNTSRMCDNKQRHSPGKGISITIFRSRQC